VRAVGLLALGLAMGLAGAVLSPSWPWLAVTGVAGTAVMVATRPRLRVWWAAGFGAVPLWLSWPQGEGDVLLAGTTSLVLACLGALWLGVALAGLLPATRSTSS
jgi:hypothetical protein